MRVTLVLFLTLGLFSTSLSRTFRNYERRGQFRRPTYVQQVAIDPCGDSCDQTAQCCARISASSFGCLARPGPGQTCDPSLMPSGAGCPCVRGTTCLPVAVDAGWTQFRCQNLPPIDPDETDFTREQY